MKTIAWSYTALTAYETCPRQFYRTRVKKDVVSEMGEEAKWGDMVHKKLEARLKDGVALPPELAKYEPLVAKLDAAPGETLTELEQFFFDHAPGQKIIAYSGQDAVDKLFKLFNR